MADVITHKKQMQEEILRMIDKEYTIERELVISRCILSFGFTKDTINTIIDALIKTRILKERNGILSHDLDSLDKNGYIKEEKLRELTTEEKQIQLRREVKQEIKHSDTETADGYNPEAIYANDKDEDN